MASKKKANGIQIFDVSNAPGKRVALDLSKADAIEEGGKGEFFVTINGNRHAIKSESSLEDMIAGEPTE